MATEFNKAGSGRFNSKNKFSGRSASRSNDAAGKPSFKSKSEKFNSGDKKVFNRSERFDRGNNFGGNRGNGESAGDRENRSTNRFGGFKSSSKFKKPGPFAGKARFAKDEDTSDRSPRLEGSGDDKREGGERPRQPYNPNRNFNTENRYRKSPFGDVPKGKPGERNRSFKAEKEAHREKLQKEGNSHEERFANPKPFNRERTEGNDEPRSNNRFNRDENTGERRPGFRSREDDNRERKPYSRDRNDAGDRKPVDRTRGNDDRKPYGRAREERADQRKPYGRGREAGNDQRPSFNRSRDDDQRPSRGEFVKKPFGKRDHEANDRKPAGRNANDRVTEAPDYDLRRFHNRERSKNESGGRQEEGIRLNRYIANAGICSRREADNLIAAGEIKVNGEIITEMGYMVKPEDTVQYGKKKLNREKMVYVLLNKPKDFITTTDDPEGRKTVMDLIANASKERIFPVGRLDRNTTGLLLFTNDGELAQKLTHPSHKNSKIYQVELDKPITKEDFDKIQAGLELEDGKAEVDDLALIGDTSKFLGIEIHIGKNRIVRRIFEHLGYEVVSLDRVQYAGLTKKDLPRGKWRFLNEKEVVRLKYFQ